MLSRRKAFAWLCNGSVPCGALYHIRLVMVDIGNLELGTSSMRRYFACFEMLKNILLVQKVS